MRTLHQVYRTATRDRDCDDGVDRDAPGPPPPSGQFAGAVEVAIGFAGRLGTGPELTNGRAREPIRAGSDPDSRQRSQCGRTDADPRHRDVCGGGMASVRRRSLQGGAGGVVMAERAQRWLHRTQGACADHAPGCGPARCCVPQLCSSAAGTRGCRSQRPSWTSTPCKPGWRPSAATRYWWRSGPPGASRASRSFRI